MKINKKTAAIVASSFISLCFLAGCGDAVSVNTDNIMLVIDVKPTISVSYEEYTKKALDDYFAVAENYTDADGDIDHDNEAVQQAAMEAATKLFAYACYNERRLDQYVYFSSQDGETDLGSTGSATAMKQEYYLRINEQEGVTCGYKYQYSIKKVIKSEGTIKMFQDQFESARTRIVKDTDQLYRLEGKNYQVGGKNKLLDLNILKCDWETGSDWGVDDLPRLVKTEFIQPENIRADIEDVAGKDNITMHANINILADGILDSAYILKDVNEETGLLDGYILFMSVNTEVANSDSASRKMLIHANGDSDCAWDGEDGLAIVCRIWENGLFRMYNITERWKGRISGFSGTVDSSTVYYYSYSDRDCDMTEYLKILEEADAKRG